MERTTFCRVWAQIEGDPSVVAQKGSFVVNRSLEAVTDLMFGCLEIHAK
jgi:hypothetical protein